MRGRYGDDPLALEVVGVGLECLKRLCTRYTDRPWPDVAGGAR
jgi:hypothetical protein